MTTDASLSTPRPGASTRVALPALIDQENRRHHRRRALGWSSLLIVPALGVALGVALRPQPVPLARRFRAEAATQGDVVREVRATGRLEAQSTVLVGAEVSGRIASVEVDYNDAVRVGQVLARFDPTVLTAQLRQVDATLSASRAALRQAETDRDQAQRNLERTARLFTTHLVSEADRDGTVFARRAADDRVRAASAQVAAQQAAAAVARTNLAHAVIRAPIDGVVITRNIDPGQTVVSALQSAVLFSVAADLRRMRVVAAVDEADVGEVSPSQRVEFTVNAYINRVFVGTVTEVRNAPVITQDVVTYGAVVEVDNPDLALKPGMTASVRIRTGASQGVLRVPDSALHFTPPGQRAGAPGVWLLSGASLRHVDLQPGLTDGTWTAVAPGAITAGTRVLVELTQEGRTAYGISH